MIEEALIPSQMRVAATAITGTGTYRPGLTGQAKLPKLKITKFNGTLSDWFQFWNEYEGEIDKNGAPQITSFLTSRSSYSNLVSSYWLII